MYGSFRGKAIVHVKKGDIDPKVRAHRRKCSVQVDSPLPLVNDRAILN